MKMNWLMGHSKSALQGDDLPADLSDMLRNMDKAIQDLPCNMSAELQPKWDAMREALHALEKEKLSLKTALEDLQKKAEAKEKEAEDLMRQTGDLHCELKQKDDSIAQLQSALDEACMQCKDKEEVVCELKEEGANAVEIHLNDANPDEPAKRVEEAETKQSFQQRFAAFVRNHPNLRQVARNIDLFGKRLDALQTISNQSYAHEVEQEIQTEVKTNFLVTDQEGLQALSCSLSDTTVPVSLDKILSQLGPFKYVPGWGTIISNFLENVGAVKQEYSQTIGVHQENQEIEELFNEYLLRVYSKLHEDGNEMLTLEKDFDDGEKELKMKIRNLSQELACNRPLKNRGKKEQERNDTMQRLMDYYSKHMNRVRSHASQISFLEARLTCFRDHMDSRQQEYISELSQHSVAALRKQEQAKQVKEWSEEKNKRRREEKLYGRWCELIAQVLQQDAANTLMKCFSLLDMCARWTVWVRSRLDQAEQNCSSANKLQTLMVKQLCSDEQIYQGAHDRAETGSELLLKFRYCIEGAYTELIQKCQCDETLFRENLSEYEKRWSAVRQSLSSELQSRREHFQGLVCNSMVQEQQLEIDLAKMEYANLGDDDDKWEKTVKKLDECKNMRASYEMQREHINRLVIEASLNHLALADSSEGVLPDVQMHDWLEEFYFTRPRRYEGGLHALTDARQTGSLQKFEAIALDGDHTSLSTREGDYQDAEFHGLREQLKDNDE